MSQDKEAVSLKRRDLIDAVGLVFIAPFGEIKSRSSVCQWISTQLSPIGAPFSKDTLYQAVGGYQSISETGLKVFADWMHQQLKDKTTFERARALGVLDSLDPGVLGRNSPQLLQLAGMRAPTKKKLPEIGANQRFFEAWCRIRYPLETRGEPNWGNLLIRFAHAANINEAEMTKLMKQPNRLPPAVVTPLLVAIDFNDRDPGSKGRLIAVDLHIIEDLRAMTAR